jgi:hypothetical protein
MLVPRGLAATATATLMCADGWFGLCTSAPGHPFAYAVAEATAELMVAAVCLVIGLRTQQDAAGRPSDDLRRPTGPAVAWRAAVGAGPVPRCSEGRVRRRGRRPGAGLLTATAI